MRATYVRWSNPSNDNFNYLLTINWSADGQKHLKVVINDGATPIMTDCFESNSNGQSIGTKIYSVQRLGGGSVLSVRIEGWTGTCNGGTVCQTQDIPVGGSLAIKSLKVLSAKNVGNNTVINFSGESTNDADVVTLNVTLSNGKIKYYNVLLWDKLTPTDVWEVTINNLTNQVLTIKKK